MGKTARLAEDSPNRRARVKFQGLKSRYKEMENGAPRAAPQPGFPFNPRGGLVPCPSRWPTLRKSKRDQIGAPATRGQCIWPVAWPGILPPTGGGVAHRRLRLAMTQGIEFSRRKNVAHQHLVHPNLIYAGSPGAWGRPCHRPHLQSPPPWGPPAAESPATQLPACIKPVHHPGARQHALMAMAQVPRGQPCILL
ncbi:hypothetical protein GWK47_009062 [Chionoecetes opilio]|uniref:Uncharacterized protein n=1 Tax=Chionoecetes opilio TaxID=41210 RepID=A0A8J5CR15_CHIOP|nr:hypothetical protein GWK47_009062 [Chionoecetes opilio]